MIREALNRLRSSQSGAAVIELAISAPILATLVIGMSDLARAYSMKLQLEQAAQRTIESVEQQKGVLTAGYAALSTEATSAATAAGYPDATNSVDYWMECNGTRQGDGTAGNGFNGSCTGTQVTSRYVDVTITGKFSPIFGLTFFATHNSDNTVNVKGHAGIRIQ